MKKKFISLFLALTMVMALLPTVGLAASSGSCGNGVTWTLDDSGRLTIDGQGAMDDGIGPWEKLPYKSITSVVIKGGVTHVGEQAFWNCLAVESLTVEEGVTSLGSEAFASFGSRETGCRVSLPSTLTEIPYGAFQLSFISSINLPSGLTSIGQSAFYMCEKLTSVTVPASVKAIGYSAFQDCKDLTSVTLQGVPDSVDGMAFYGMSTNGTISFNGTQEQWDTLAARDEYSTNDILFGANAPTPAINILVESPRETITMELANKGTVELSEDNPNLEFDIYAPAGTEKSSYNLILYTVNGKYIDTMEDNRVGTITKSPAHVSYPMWRTPQNGALVYSDCSLTLGETYRYELQAVLNGKTYSSGMGTVHLAEAKEETFTVSLLNTINMTYLPDITVTNGQPYGKLPTPSLPSGQIFDGWYNGDKELITEDTIVDLTGDETLYAYWHQEQAVTLTHANTPVNGVVEVSAQNSQLKAIFSAPQGKKFTKWEIVLYNTNGSVVGRITENADLVTTGESGPLAIYLWTEGGTPKEGQVMDYGKFKLTVGTTYEYEFTAVVDGTTYSTGKAKFRLSTTAAQTGGTAYASTQKVLVDGKSVEFQAYALKDANGYDTNYVKLRDVAMVLNGTSAQFNVGWDGAVNIQTKTAYKADGSEMHTPFSGNRPYTDSTTRTMVDGKAVAMDAILLQDDAGGGYTYYKLRDLGASLGFQVDWTAETGITIKTK